MNRPASCLLLGLLAGALVTAPAAENPRWQLAPTRGTGIAWEVAHDQRVPHGDRVEMSGLNVSLIAAYDVGVDHGLDVRGQVIWPNLIVKYDYRSYLKRTFDTADLPAILIDGRPLVLPAVQRVSFDGVLRFDYATTDLAIRRALFPSRRHAAVFERWEITNPGPVAIELAVDGRDTTESVEGVEGEFLTTTKIRPVQVSLAPHASTTWWVEFSARRRDDPPLDLDADAELADRNALIDLLSGHLRLRTPDPVIDEEFRLAKLRAAESIFATKIGLIHSPGGGRYYGGIWANDEIEYAHPFFAYLGYDPANDAALNGCRVFMRAMTPAYQRIPYSFEMAGALPSRNKDRGDAAMFAYGTSLYALTRGDPAVARELWPGIQWCLEYCRRQLTPEGVVASTTDEMEGRIPTGTANLSTSALAYGGLLNAARLARELGEPAAVAEDYTGRAAALREAIEHHFGADIEGYHTYRYFEGHEKLRHWICLPLVMGIDERREGTIRALLEKLWTPNGLLVENGLNVFWDRATLYALRGLFISGATDEAFDHLADYTRQRMLGEHVPYPVEAWPEGGQAHLSAESALYCRVIIEGLFGIQPTGLRQFTCTPRLPAGWTHMALEDIHAFGQIFSIAVGTDPAGGGTVLRVSSGGETVFTDSGTSFVVELPGSTSVRRPD